MQFVAPIVKWFFFLDVFKPSFQGGLSYHFAMNENEFPQQYMKLSVDLHLNQCLVLPMVRSLAILLGTLMFHCCFNVNFSDHMDVDHLFTCFFAICESS